VAGVVSGGSKGGAPLIFRLKLRPEGAKKIFRDQATPLSQGVDVPLPRSQVLDPALVMSVIGRENPLFSYANSVVRKIIIFILFHWKDL